MDSCRPEGFKRKTARRLAVHHRKKGKNVRPFRCSCTWWHLEFIESKFPKPKKLKGK